MGFRQILAALALWCVAGAAAADGLAWRVTAPAGGTLYLAGTVHAARPDFYPLPAPIDDAFAASDVLVLEVDVTRLDPGAAAQFMRGRGYLGADTSLDELLAEDDWHHAAEWGRKLGLGSENLKRMQPWLAAVSLVSLEMQQLGLDPQLGMDRRFAARAVERAMDVTALETLEEQLSALANLSLETQLSFLENSLTTPDEFRASVDAILESWRDGDAARLAKVLDESYDGAAEVYEAVMRARNLNWLPQIERMLASDDVHFVAVGSLHLVGEDGLVELLAARGYEVEQL